MVKWISLPWRWFIASPIAHPSLEQIDGSKLILKDGMYHLSTQDLVSWWPFLLLSVLFYGLLPRMGLLAAALWIRNHKLKHLALDTADCDKLMGRLMTPVVTTQAALQTPARQPETLETTESAPPPSNLPPKQAPAPVNTIAALIPEDIFDRCQSGLLEEHIHAQLGPGFDLVQTSCIEGNLAADRTLVDELMQISWQNNRPQVLILQEAWQPPIKEALNYFTELRQLLGPQAKIIILLIGMPTGGTIFTPVTDQNWTIWRQKITQLADPYLRLEKI
jgi:hypothetical protein